MEDSDGYHDDGFVGRAGHDARVEDLDALWRHAMDSPSKQLLLELKRQQEEYERDVNSKLDQEALDRLNKNRLALAAAAVEHERIRQRAEREHELLQLELERTEWLREDEQKRALARAKQEAVEREIQGKRTEIEEARRLEERRQAAEDAQREADAEAERVRKRREEEEVAAAERRRREQEEEKAQRQREAANQSSVSTGSNLVRLDEQPAPPSTLKSALLSKPSATPHQSASSGPSAGTGTLQETHKNYLELHQRLKQMRKSLMDQNRQNPELKRKMGDGRREMRKCVGQLVNDRTQNKQPQAKITSVLRDALTLTQPSIDVRPFIVSPLPPHINQAQSQVPALLIYLLNIFSKAIISQLIDEAGVALKAADPTGILAISIFAGDAFRWQGVSMIDILLAKYHVVCPVLFGIYGSEKTESGRRKLGWKMDPETGTWVTQQRHSERMTGLGGGYAALTLRNFKNVKITNPLPPPCYWQALACIVNTPAQDITQTHLMVLKALIENHAASFIGFYGRAAVAALRKAVIEFPQQAPPSVASSALSTLASSIQKSLHLTL